MIVEMSKIKLLGLIDNREEIMNSLFKCGCVELSDVESVDNMNVVTEIEDYSPVQENFDRSNKIIEFISDTFDKTGDKNLTKGVDVSLLKNFFVPINEFTDIITQEEDILADISVFEGYQRSLSDLRSDINKTNNLISQLKPYLKNDKKFSDYFNTDYVKCFYGLIKGENLQLLKNSLDRIDYLSLEVIFEDELCLVCVYCHKNHEIEVTEKLNELGFSKCPFDFDCSAEEKIKELNGEIENFNTRTTELTKKVLDDLYKIRNIKILSDYYKLALEKNKGEQGFLYTEKTFLLQGYIPTDKIEEVKQKLGLITDAIYYDISKPEKDDNPPTLVKNKKVVRQTEFITDLYSTPNYREMDPSKVIFVFFMLFMGIIMADVGYGVLMVIIGLMLANKIKVDNGTRRLWYIITLGGISTIIFGLLFNSFFGVAVLKSSILPNPVPSSENGGDMTNLMLVLLGCLGIGVIQIAVGYACKAINCFKQGDVLGGIFEGIDWVIFFVGLVFTAIPILFKMLLPSGIEGVMSEGACEFFYSMQTPGLVIVILTVVTAALTAGRNEKGFGKFSKGFGAVYGLINLMSDILSYARLFGLMLSGMIIASTFNDLGLGLMEGGIIGTVLGPVVIVVGHVFNISMNVLGAYIHDSRLQYIEFFGKFYTGEGRKFTPFGSQTEYIYITK